MDIFCISWDSGNIYPPAPAFSPYYLLQMMNCSNVLKKNLSLHFTDIECFNVCTNFLSWLMPSNIAVPTR